MDGQVHAIDAEGDWVGSGHPSPDDGTYTMPGLAAGTYSVVLRASGFTLRPTTKTRSTRRVERWVSRSRLARLHPSSSVVLGGTGVVSDAVVAELGEYGPVTRLAGDNRYGTSVAISKYAYPDGADAVLVAVGTGFADALAGGPLAAKLGGPVLLTATDALPTSIRDEIVRLDPSTIIVLGGTAVVTPAVFDELSSLADSTVRLAGANRYETAVEISKYGWSDTTGVGSVYVATGANFPDALAGAVEAAAKGMPILLTDTNTLPAVVGDEIDRLGVDTIYILGGTGVVSTTVETQLGTHLAP